MDEMADVFLLAAPEADDAAMVAMLLPALGIEMAVVVERRGEAIAVAVAAFGKPGRAGEIEADGLQAFGVGHGRSSVPDRCVRAQPSRPGRERASSGFPLGAGGAIECRRAIDGGRSLTRGTAGAGPGRVLLAGLSARDRAGVGADRRRRPAGLPDDRIRRGRDHGDRDRRRRHRAKVTMVRRPEIDPEARRAGPHGHASTETSVLETPGVASGMDYPGGGSEHRRDRPRQRAPGGLLHQLFGRRPLLHHGDRRRAGRRRMGGGADRRLRRRRQLPRRSRRRRARRDRHRRQPLPLSSSTAMPAARRRSSSTPCAAARRSTSPPSRASWRRTATG